jgi:5-hydroxyisourate hydrolase-like protein (transthyretin family)
LKTKATTSIILTLFFLSLLSSAFTTPLALASSDGSLVGLWHFDEGIGSIASDLSGNGNDGTLSGGKFGNALNFDGNDYVEILDSSSLEPNAITVEAWVKSSSIGAYRYIVSKYLPTRPGIYSSYGLYTGSSGGLRFYIGYGSSWIGSPDAGIGVWDGKWHHVAGTFDNNDPATVKLYVDGIQVDGATSTIQDVYYEGIGNLYIGAYRSDWLFFIGAIDEVRISNVALTSFDLTQAPQEVTGQTIALWHFDESVGSAVYDETTNDNDGTIHGASWAGPTWATGKYNYALHFDGIDDFVSLGQNTFSDSDLATYTFEAWINIETLDGVQRRIFDDEGGLRPMLTSGNKLEAFHWDSTAWTGKTVTWMTTPNVDHWYHIAQTYDGTNMKFYVEGNLIGSCPADAWEPDGLNRDVNIASKWSLGNYWKGLIDEARIYNEALSADWIKLHSMGYYSGGFDSGLSDSVIQKGDYADLAVRVFDAYDAGVEGVTVDFDQVAGPDTIPLLPLSDATSAGLAEIDTGAIETQGVYTVQASINGVFLDDWILVVYDPTAGFVTGGGWIMSPAGAYADDPCLTGKANFGFVSKYKKGATVPDGQTEFKFEVADFEFHSLSYEWLVVAGGSGRAQFKGSGTVNDAGDYGFILTAIDGKLSSSSDEDLFRIKIWDKTTGEVVYDNKMGAPDSGDPDTAIGGGSIVIHTK